MVEFRAHPYVCGALGQAEQGRIDRLLAAAPDRVLPIGSDPRFALFAGAGLTSWRHGDRHGWFWSPLASGSAPTRWEEAAGSRMAAGLAVHRDAVVLHGCGLGLQELYTRRMGEAVYFSTRLAPLLDIDKSPVHTDWEAWASSLALGAPMGDATPFLEVRRVPAATAWRTSLAAGVSTLRFTPSWLTADPSDQVTVADILDAVAEQLPQSRILRRTAITLSGGWDSRLLGALAARKSRRPVIAYTTSPDDGYDDDILLSRPVATGLGMRHRVVVPPGNAWDTDRVCLYERTQHQVWLHTWLIPLARLLWRRREPLLDGLAGDVLFKGLFVGRATVAAAAGGGLGDALWMSLTANKLAQPGWFAPAVAARFEDAARTRFAQIAGDFDGHPAAATLIVLHTRTARVIAPSPLNLFAPEADIRLPFVHPDVLKLALAISPEAKFDGALYRRLLLGAAGEKVGLLPSTNDPRPTRTAGPRRQTDGGAMAAIAAQIENDEVVRELLGPQLRPALTDAAARSRISANNSPRAVLQWAAMFAHWRATYAARLAD